MEPKTAFTLPTNLIGTGDISRLLRELNSLSDFLVSADYKQEDEQSRLGHASPLLAQLAAQNNFNLLDKAHRDQLRDHLQQLSKSAPVLHMSFVSDPSPKSVETLLVWLRTNIDPLVLLQIGLQPNIAVGAVVRTPNKVIDISLKETLKKEQPYLLKMLRGAAG